MVGRSGVDELRWACQWSATRVVFLIEGEMGWKIQAGARISASSGVQSTWLHAVSRGGRLTCASIEALQSICAETRIAGA
jgi:hypothetical protein